MQDFVLPPFGAQMPINTKAQPSLFGSGQVLQRGVEKTVRREDADFAAKQPNVQSRLSLSAGEIPVKFKLDSTSKLKLELLPKKLELFKK